MKTIPFLIASLLLPTTLVTAEDRDFYELRVYHANPGKLDALHARFRDHTVALFDKHGMEQLGYFIPVENEESNILVYWLAYADKAARDKAWMGFRGDPDWKAAYKASTEDGKLISKVDSIFLEATDYSPAIGRLIGKDDARLFEWRTYTTEPGRLANINARFRDHTCALFEKHGMENLAYWNFVKGQEKSEVTLSYLIAHDSREKRDASFGAFRVDPAWKSAREASVKDGPILIKGGVKSVLLKPTDYSPVR